MTTTNTVDAIVDSYFEAWNTPGDARPAAVSAAFSEDAYYCDGSAEAIGHSQINEMMDGVMTQFDGARFELASPIDAHHGQARFAWRMRGADGTSMLDGIDAVRLAEDGRISTTLGFFGVTIPEPSAETTAHTFNWERTYKVPADQLFEVVSDLGVYADVAPNLSRIDILEGEGEGMVRQCTNPEGESWTETYTEWVPGERFVTVVDVSTYPPSLAAMIASLEMTVRVAPVLEATSTVTVEVATQLSDLGVQVLRDGGAADALFQPILDGWGERVSV